MSIGTFFGEDVQLSRGIDGIDGDDTGLIWVYPESLAPDAFPEGTVAKLSLRNNSAAGIERRTESYLTRDQAKRVVAVLQQALDEAGPEPIVLPEDVDHLIDRDGDFWVKDANGVGWNIGGTLEAARRKAAANQGGEARTLEYVLGYGPVTPVRIVTATEELPAIEVPA